MKMGEYVKLIFVNFLLQCGFVSGGVLPWLTGFLVIAAYFFFRGYYRFERIY